MSVVDIFFLCYHLSSSASSSFFCYCGCSSPVLLPRHRLSVHICILDHFLLSSVSYLLFLFLLFFFFFISLVLFNDPQTDTLTPRASSTFPKTGNSCRHSKTTGTSSGSNYFFKTVSVVLTKRKTDTWVDGTPRIHHEE